MTKECRPIKLMCLWIVGANRATSSSLTRRSRRLPFRVDHLLGSETSVRPPKLDALLLLCKKLLFDLFG